MYQRLETSRVSSLDLSCCCCRCRFDVEWLRGWLEIGGIGVDDGVWLLWPPSRSLRWLR